MRICLRSVCRTKELLRQKFCPLYKCLQANIICCSKVLTPDIEDNHA